MIEKMLKEAQVVFSYNDLTSTQYTSHGLQMLDDVNTAFRSQPELLRLIGNNPTSLMESNHMNHLSFMSTIIKYRQSDVLINTLPWVYKTYAAKGVHYDYFVEELNQWKLAIQRHVPKEAQSALLDVYDFMLDWHDTIVAISTSDKIKHFIPSTEWDDEHEQLLTLVLKGDYQFMLDQCVDMLNHDVTMEHLYQGYFQPIMYRVGEMWEQGAISVAHEHLATSTMTKLMTKIYLDYVLSDVTKGVGVISASLNEYHQLGARMVADFLEKDGWDIRYLGANTPIESLIELVREVKPVFVGLSLTMAYNLDGLIETVEKLQHVDSDKMRIMVGGLAVNNQGALQQLIGADAYPVNASESRNIANQWWQEIQHV